MVANLIMEDVEERSLATVEVKPMFWKRYVDDTCTALPVDKVQEFLDHLNSIQPSIRFTMEVESNGSFPFWMCYCNVTLTAPSQLQLVYKKPMHTDR